MQYKRLTARHQGFGGIITKPNEFSHNFCMLLLSSLSVFFLLYFISKIAVANETNSVRTFFEPKELVSKCPTLKKSLDFGDQFCLSEQGTGRMPSH